MTNVPRQILTLQLRSEQDVVLCRKRARDIAAALGFHRQDQIRIATALSEIARNAWVYGKGGHVDFSTDAAETNLLIDVVDHGSGIPNLDAVMAGSYLSQTGMGIGIRGAHRLMDLVRVDTTAKGTAVHMEKRLYSRPPLSGNLAAALELPATDAPFEEWHEQNRELVEALQELAESEAHVQRLARELEEARRGIVALRTELSEKTASLSRVSESKSRLVSSMTHEFRTPVNAILSLSTMLTRGLDGTLGEEQHKQAGFIRSSAQSLLEMVNDMLDLARVESDKVRFNVTEFTLESFFDEQRNMFQPLLTNPAVTLQFPGTAALPPVLTDQLLLAQIVRNLISNAIKYTERGSITVTASIDSADVLHISVRDSGIGIHPEDQEEVFDEFVQVEHPLQQRSKGTGLGLALARNLARVLGGDLTLTSVVGEGSTFKLALPSRLPTDASPWPADVPSLPRCILIIDDDEASRQALRALLPDGSIVFESSEGEDGLRRAGDWNPDLIFLDPYSKGIDGFEILKRLKDDPATCSIAVVILASRAPTVEERSVLESRAAVILAKDLGPADQAKGTIRKILEGRRQL